MADFVQLDAPVLQILVLLQLRGRDAGQHTCMKQGSQSCRHSGTPERPSRGHRQTDHNFTYR